MPWHEWISDMKVTVMNLAIWLLSLSWAAPRRPGGLARQHQLRGVREDGDERVGGRVTSIAPKITKAIKRRMNRTLHKSQTITTSLTFGKLTCSARVLFFDSTPSASLWRKYPSWDIKVKVMYTSANLVWTPATLLNKISKTIWQQLRSRWSFIFSNGFCALHTLALRGSCWKSLCDVPQQTRIVRYDAVHAALH